MAFTRNTFEQLTYPHSSNPKFFTYATSTDSYATVVANDYFLPVYNYLSVGDLIYLKTSDKIAMATVTTVSDSSVVIAPFVAPAAAAVVMDTVTITSAELLALRATPKTLVAAPGAGFVLEFVSAVLELDYNSAAYTESADNLAIKYENGSGAAVSQDIEMTGFIDQTADTITNALPKVDAIVPAANAVNKALVIHNTGDGELAAGDSPLRVKINYRLHATGL